MTKRVNMNDGKIRELSTLAKTLEKERAQGKKIVLCHGVFDLLHIGHIRHFEQAKRMGNILAVTMTPDRHVNKGPNRPAFTEGLRAEAIAALDCVDYVAVNQWPTAVEAIRMLCPDYYVKGSDYRDSAQDITGGITLEEEAVKSVGGKLAFTDDITFSSSSLINRYLALHPAEVTDYLTDFSSRYSSDDVLRHLEQARSQKVLVVGETIIDEYQYCELIGKSSKEPILATLYQSNEKFAGGIAAVANHVANFCNEVGMISLLGERDSQEGFVRSQLRDNVHATFLYKEDSPTLVKRRFVEGHLLQKLFEVYEMNAADLSQNQSKDLCTKLAEILPEYDVVIVVDYGHGMLGKPAIDVLTQKANFLAVNTQANAGNRGFNTISKYSRADYICIAQHEIALEERNQEGSIEEMILNVSRKLDAKRVTVTRSKDGSVCYNRDEGFVYAPAFAQQAVDRMGAGDAVISLTSLCVAKDAPTEIISFLGNVVGAEAVATLAHRNSIEPVPLARHIESLLK